MPPSSRTLSSRETLLLAAGLALVAVAWFAPPLAQPAHYHHFADQRTWLGIPCALDVLSNLSFALVGAWGLRQLGRVPARSLPGVPRGLAALCFAGLLLTALGSAWYHWRPDDAGLVVDRLGMTVVFAGLLGLGVAGRVSARAGLALALTALVLGPVSALVWFRSGNLLPWVLLQGGGMALLLAQLFLKPLPGALAVRWGAVIGIYVVAKGLEVADHAVFELTGHFVSGHSLKHLVAALAVWPVIQALRPLGQRAARP